jgi:DNA ligase-1
MTRKQKANPLPAPWFALLCLVSLFWTPTHATDLLLLKRYTPDTDVTGWLMSEKLDGVRAHWTGSELVSRQGNRFAAPKWFTEALPPFELDGELWTKRGDFARIQSITSRDEPHEGWQELGYHIFEVPHAPGGLMARLNRLRAWLREHPVEHLHIIEQIPVRDPEHLSNELERVESMGGEGLVVRNPDTPYTTGRSDQSLKVVSFETMEGAVVGYREGSGKYTGMTGALEVELPDGKRLFLGSGLSDDERRDPPPIGALVTFKHRGLTSKGLPRFASFLRVRELP